jgi:zinc protease
MRIRLAVCWLGLASCALAQNTLPQVDIPYQEFTLSNGLRVLVHEDHKAPIVAINTWYHVGSKNEKAGKTGFAHLFEHIMFGGSENFHGTYIQAMEKIGATDLNGTTENDRTNYFENVPTSALDYTLWIESDRMGHLANSIDKKVLDLQRGVVQNEKRQGENQPYGVADILMPENTYPAGHPYSWSVIGSMEDLNAASLDDVKEWFRTYYGPSNAVLVLAGDIDLKTAKEKVTKYYGDIPSGPPVAHQEVWVAKMTGTHRQIVGDRVPQARIYKVWNVPEYGAVDSDYLTLASRILAQGKTSRLYKRLIYEDQIATGVQCYNDANEIGGQFAVEVTARPGQDMAKLEQVLDEEMARFLHDGPTDAELKRAKTQYAAQLVRGIERIGGFGGKSDQLAHGEVYLNNPAQYKVSYDRIANAKIADVTGAFNRWISDGVYILTVVPFPDYKSLTAVDRTKAPALTAPPELKLPKLEHVTLKNGLKVIVAQRHDVPIVNFSMQVDAGYAADQFASPGTTSMATTLIDAGTKKRKALEISDELANLGATLNANSNLDTTTITLSALKTNVDPSLDLFADVILHPEFPESEFARIQKERIAAIQREKSTPQQMALRVFPALIYGQGHAYATPFSGTGNEASVSKMTRADLVKMHDTFFRPNNATLIVTGDTTVAEITPKLEHLFDGWKDGPVPQKAINTVPASKTPQVYLIDKPGALQSVILAGEIAPPKSDPRDIAIETVNSILGGEFGARLNMNLREDKHWSYGVQSVFLENRGPSALVVLAPVQTDKTKESLFELNKEMHSIVAGQPITDAELDKTKINETLKTPGQYETINAVSGSIGQIVRFGLPDDYFMTYPQKVSALTKASVDDTARSVLHPDSLVWIVVGDRSKIEAGIRNLKLGELKVMDADGKLLN